MYTRGEMCMLEDKVYARGQMLVDVNSAESTYEYARQCSCQRGVYVWKI